MKWLIDGAYILLNNPIATDFGPMRQVCRNIVFMSLQLEKKSRKKVGMSQKSPYLCTNKKK
jgi:hypothetical protein